MSAPRARFPGFENGKASPVPGSGILKLTDRPGKGEKRGGAGRIYCLYEIWSLDGVLLDSSRRRSEPASFREDDERVPRWFSVATSAMSPGERARFLVPPGEDGGRGTPFIVSLRLLSRFPALDADSPISLNALAAFAGYADRVCLVHSGSTLILKSAMLPVLEHLRKGPATAAGLFPGGGLEAGKREQFLSLAEKLLDLGILKRVRAAETAARGLRR